MTMIAAVVGVDRELDVAAAGVDADRADDVDRDVAQPLVLAVGQRHRRRDGDASRRCARPSGRGSRSSRRPRRCRLVVAHQLELVLLPAEDRLLEQHLGGRAGLQPGAGDPAQLVLVVGQPGAGAAHRERRPHDHRVAELVRGGQAVVQGVADQLRRRLGADAGDDLLELLRGPPPPRSPRRWRRSARRRTPRGRRPRAAPSRCSARSARRGSAAARPGAPSR